MPTQPQQNQNPEKRGFWHDLSIPQLLAGALAAVTSMLLSNQIGIAGSVIGVAVGSIVSAVSGAAYKSLINRSASAVKQVIPSSFERSGQSDAAQSNEPDSDQTTLLADNAATPTQPPRDATQVMHRPSFAANPEDVQSITPEQDKLIAEEFGVDPYLETHIAPQELLVRAQKRRRREQLKLVLVTLVSGLVAVAISAAVVLFLTQGEGLGEKRSVVTYVPETTVQTTPSDSEKTDETTSDADANKAEKDNASDSKDAAADTSGKDATTSTSGETPSSAAAGSSTSASGNESGTSSESTEPTNTETDSTGTDSTGSGSSTSDSAAGSTLSNSEAAVTSGSKQSNTTTTTK